MRVDFEIGLYPEHFMMALKWYNLAFNNDKKPSPKDMEAFTLFDLMVKDMARQDKEDAQVPKE